MVETAAATTATLDWAVAAAAAVMAPKAWADEMAWVRREATTVELVRSTVAEEVCRRRRRLPAGVDVPFRTLLAMAVRTASSAAAVVVEPEMRAMPWVRIVWMLALVAMMLAA